MWKTLERLMNSPEWTLSWGDRLARDAFCVAAVLLMVLVYVGVMLLIEAIRGWRQ